MERNLSFKMNRTNIAQIFFALFIISLFFPIRHIFINHSSYSTGLYSDFLSFSLYLSDILLFFSFLCILPRGINYYKLPLLYITWLLVGILALKSENFQLNWYFWLKYVELAAVAYGTAAFLAQRDRFIRNFVSFFVFLCSFESILAIFQFISQKSLGLYRLGEPYIYPLDLGLAKIVVSGTKYVRAYGTFPHPNLLSAFLFTGIMFNIWLLLKYRPIFQRLSLSFLLLLNIIGITVTFSRAGFLALAIGLITLFVIILFKSSNRKIIIQTAGVVILSIFISFSIFHKFLDTRATISDQASKERIFYAKISLQIIKNHPWFGTGIGESLLHMQQYSPVKLWPWEIQPVHNYFLLTAAESGIVSALLIILFFLIHIKHLIMKIGDSGKPNEDLLPIFLLVIFFGYLILMQFDHYFYTLEQTQMLLWVMLGIIFAQTKSPIQIEKGI